MPLPFHFLPSPPFPQTVGTGGADLQDYMYYFTPAPWLSVMLLKLVQMYPAPGEDDALTKARLVESIDAILNRSQVCAVRKSVVSCMGASEHVNIRFEEASCCRGL